MKSISTGKILISLVALWAAFGSYIFDWNKTHIFNPNWPPHAKFHNAQDMLLGTMMGLLALWILWAGKGEKFTMLRITVLLSSFYWLTQFGALFFPGTALTDPEFAYPGQPPAQLIVDVVMISILTIGYLLELKKLKQLNK
jgi:hypothetical protein